MVKVICIRCNGEAEGKTADEAANRIDHAIGLSKGRACAGGDGAPYKVIGAVAAPEPKAKPVAATVRTKASKPKKKSK